MDRDQAGPSRPKRACVGKFPNEREIQLLLDSDEEDNVFDFDDSGSECSVGILCDKNSSESEDDDVVVPSFDDVPPQIVWQDNPNLKQFPFSKQKQLLVPIPGEGNPYDFFRFLLDDTFLNLLVNETNKYAEYEFLRLAANPRSRISLWKPVTLKEMLTFIGLVIHTGTIQLSRINDYWKKHHLFNLTCFSNHMSRDRYLLIMRNLHFSDNSADSNDSDRLFKIRPLINYFNDKMSNVYYPGKELSLDESMILWRGRLLFRQFIQNKRHKYGIKLYMLTEPNGIILKFAVYTGATDDLGGKGHAANVVLHLMEEKLNTGHSIFMDNFYNSYDLAQKLLEKHTYCTGTLRVNRVNTPKDVVNAKLKVGETVSKYSNNVMIGKWKDKREVTYISSEFQNDMVPTINRKGRETLKPLPIKHYNKFMSGIDRQDQMISYYPFTRKTIRWYKKLGIHIIQMLLLNSYNLYNQYNIGSTLSLYDFRIIVLSKLLPKPEAPSKSLSIENHLPSTHGMGENGRNLRKRCQLCYKNGIRKDSTYFCDACPKKPSLCITTCFKKFHTQ